MRAIVRALRVCESKSGTRESDLCENESGHQQEGEDESDN